VKKEANVGLQTPKSNQTR